MTENIKFWLRNLYMEEMGEALGAASNEHLWALGSDGESAEQHEANSAEQYEYASILNRLSDDIENIESKKNKNIAVIISTSYSEASIHLFDNMDDARRFLRNAYDEDLRIEKEENGFDVTSYISPDNTYGTMIVNTDVTIYSIGSVYDE